MQIPAAHGLPIEHNIRQCNNEQADKKKQTQTNNLQNELQINDIRDINAI
jgi:hypothetical protein